MGWIKSTKRFRKKSVGRLVWMLLRALPHPLRAQIVRTLLPVPPIDYPPGIIFKRAESYTEIEAALHLVYESYQERKLVPHNEHKLRLTKYHALPTTAILIAKKGDEVIATLSLILDSALGLPIEELWDISMLRGHHKRIAEVSSLAIKRGYRAHRGELLFPLCKYMYLMAKDHLGVDSLVAAVHPMVKDFYQCILLFKEIDNKVHHYSFAEGAKAVGLHLPIDGTAEQEWIRTYDHLPTPKNYNRYFVTLRKLPTFHFPQESACHVGHFVLSPGLLEYLFTHCSHILSQLSPQERQALSNVYFLPEYQSVIGVQDQATLHKRSHPRFAVMIHANLKKSDILDQEVSGSVIEASQRGVKMRIPSPGVCEFSPGQKVEVTMALSPHKNLTLSGQIQWASSSPSILGIDFQKECPLDWRTFIRALEQQLILVASAQTTPASVRNTGT